MSSVPLSAPQRALARASRLQRAIHALRSEGDTRGREAAAVGTGLLIGCTPFWGTHFFVCWGAGWVLRLNRIKIYLAANLINPLILPALLYAEVQSGAWVRRGETMTLSMDALSAIGPWQFGADLVVGSFVVGALVGAIGALITYVARRPVRDPFYRLIARRAADRYIDAGITAWEFARAKLSGDPVYRHVLDEYIAGASGTLVDLGCGQGLMLALVAEAQETAAAGQWDPNRPAPPGFTRMLGIETRTRIASMAARALEDEAEIVTGDIREHGLPPTDVLLLFDVLHMLPADDQDVLLEGVGDALAPGGRVLIREANPRAGWRFVMVRVGNRIKWLATGHLRQTLTFRTPEAWMAALDAIGCDATVVPMSEGTPFGNVLISGTRRASD